MSLIPLFHRAGAGAGAGAGSEPELQPGASEWELEQAPTLCWSKARTDYISGLGAGLTFISRLAGLTFIS